MEQKFQVLKLLWANLRHLKEKGESPNDTFDFLNENEMIKYLFNEDERYVELLLVSMEMMQNPEMVRKLNPKFMELYQSFFVQKTKSKNKENKENKVLMKNKTKEVVEEIVEEKESEDEEVVEEAEAEEEDDAVEEDVDEEDVDEEDVEEEDHLEKFFESCLETDEESKVSVTEVKERYQKWCKENNEKPENIIDFLENKVGKPKGKSVPKFNGLRLA